jgi:cell division protein FtsX
VVRDGGHQQWGRWAAVVVVTVMVVVVVVMMMMVGVEAALGVGVRGGRA